MAVFIELVFIQIKQVANAFNYSMKYLGIA